MQEQQIANEASDLPPIPNKRYFTIGEVSKLCAIKTHVLRYWEQEFRQLNPTRRRNRRYYQLKDVQMVRKIRYLLYKQGFTIGGARLHLATEHKEDKQWQSSFPPQTFETKEAELKKDPSAVPLPSQAFLLNLVTELEELLAVLEK